MIQTVFPNNEDFAKIQYEFSKNVASKTNGNFPELKFAFSTDRVVTNESINFCLFIECSVSH